MANLSGGPSQLDLWHKRFGPLNYRDLKSSVPIELKDENAKCETCCLAKIFKTPVPKQTESKDIEDDRFFDISFNEENVEPDNQIEPTIEPLMEEYKLVVLYNFEFSNQDM